MVSLKAWPVMVILLIVPLTGLKAQQAVVAFGGEAAGTGGTMSHSSGQTDYLYFSSEAGSMQCGVQQVFEYFLLFSWTGAQDTDWLVVLNWNPQQVPAEGHDILIPTDMPNYPVLAGSHTARNLRIQTNASLSIDPTGKLTVKGLLANEAGINGLMLLSGLIGQDDTLAARTGSLIHNTPGVQAKVYRYVTGEWESWDAGWHLVSSPVAEQPIETFITTGAGNGFDFYGWDEESSTWKNYKASDFAAWNQGPNFNPGQGYLLSYEQTQEYMYFSGELNVEDIIKSGLTQSSNPHSGWHLLGNPFSSALQWNDGNWALSNMAGTAKIWVESGKSYTDITTGEIIPSAQGFWVQVSGPANSLTIPAAARTHSDQPWYKNPGIQKILLTAREQSGHSFQESQLLVNPEASSGFDFYHDSRFLAGYAPFFYSIKDQEMLSTISLPYISEELVIPYGFLKNAAEAFRIELSEEIPGTPLYLRDLKLNVEHRLGLERPYEFISTAGDDPLRFELRFSPAGATGIDEGTAGLNVHIYSYQKTLYINLNQETGRKILELYDLNGRLQLRRELPEGLHFSHLLHLPDGIYLVRLTTKSGVHWQKVFVR